MWLLAEEAKSVTITLTPCADTTLIGVAPSNNNGGQAWFNSGTTQNGPSDRALLRFDLTFIPTNATVLSASLVVSVVRQPRDGLVNAPFGLHRMLRPWGEGNKASTVSPGQGLPATAGEATWTHSFYPTNAWSAPGGVAGIDYSGVESSFQFIYGTTQSPFLFDSTPELAGDVQGWVRQPGSNYGWMLLCDDEGTPFTARRFGSREDPNNAPVLEVQYLVPPRIDQAHKNGNQFTIGFTASPGQGYTVECGDGLGGGAWSVLTRLDAVQQPTLVLVVDVASKPQRFYRLVTY